MKKLIISISILAVLFSSCKKCGTCTTKITTSCDNYNVKGFPQETTSKFDACDEKLIEAENATSTTTSTVGLYTITVFSKTTCVPKNN